MVCVVLRGADLYVGKVGSGVGLFRHNGETQPFPTDFSYREALNPIRRCSIIRWMR
jgi:hypothetical protein